MNRENSSQYFDKDVTWPMLKSQIPNAQFVFHNKLPKAGSTTLNAILRQLSNSNNFRFRKVETREIANDKPFLEQPLAVMINAELARSENQKQKYFLLKHHYWMDFQKFNMSQPTFINVVREPTSWFTSRYYFKRYGWKNNNNARVEMSPTERNRSINDCIVEHYDECTSFSHQPYLSYFCGCADICKSKSRRHLTLNHLTYRSSLVEPGAKRACFRVNPCKHFARVSYYWHFGAV